MNGVHTSSGSSRDLAPLASRDLASLPSSKEAASFHRLVLFLTSLPLLLALFAYAVLGPPLPPMDPASLYSDSLDNNTDSTGSTGSTGAAFSPGCPRSIKKNFHFPLGQWHASLQPLPSPRLAILTTTAAGMEQVLPWLYYHRSLGVELFFLFAEGTAATPENVAVLETIPGVKVIPRSKDLDELQSYKPGRNRTLLWDMAGKPCNYELFVRQALNGDTAIPLAQAEGVDWLFHIDTDELLNPGAAPEFSLQTLLGGMNASTNLVVFSNYETVVERDDVQEPFLEVTLFKKSAHHIHPEIFKQYAGEATHGNPNYMLTYGNGKSAARVSAGLRSTGAHRFNNPRVKYKEHVLKEASVLHYSYTRFSDLTSRSKRCHCRPTKKSVKKCFFLEFDRQAFIVAATMTEEQMLLWYRRRVVWSDKGKVLKMLRANMFARIYTPQVVIRGILSSGLIEATLKAGQEEFQKRQFLKHLYDRSNGVLPHNTNSSSSRAAEGAWNSILSSVYGLVSSVQQQQLRALGFRGQSIQELLELRKEKVPLSKVGETEDAQSHKYQQHA